ncbi:MAG TPA: hypothetical protein VEA80_18455 [Vitreimonas sp.]|uniref:hypothetical protein n=1 Tax=Vitreimonas sp. TaxID=3069702 RepID=UPI002D327015|nr:hypothetical protein [Vitreimonas sp.]HYD89468.1 hypothetical protein [Vitreimonas sp.]
MCGLVHGQPPIFLTDNRRDFPDELSRGLRTFSDRRRVRAGWTITLPHFLDEWLRNRRCFREQKRELIGRGVTRSFAGELHDYQPRLGAP